MSDLSIAPVVCVRCGTSMTGQYHYLGALGPLCGRCFGEEMAANRAAYQAVPAYGAEPDREPRIRELEAKVERLEAERESFYMDYRMKCDAETKALHVKVERLEASVERTARAFRACEQAREDAAALHRAEVEQLRADPRLTLTADDLYVVLSWCPVGNETAGRVRRVADALEEA